MDKDFFFFCGMPLFRLPLRIGKIDLENMGTRQPLLLGGTVRRRMSPVAASVAAMCAVGAVAAVAVMVKGGSSALLQRGIIRMKPVRGMVPMQAVGQREGEEPVYYIPMKQVMSKSAKQSPILAAKPQPVVYYYIPEAKMQTGVHHQMLANETDGTATADGNGSAVVEFVCTVDNIKALSATVQTAWDVCKDHKDYVAPNAEAVRRRRLLGWVWEPQSGEAQTAAPKHYPSFYRNQMLANDTEANGTDAAGGSGPSFDECQQAAAKDACASIASCKNPVCDSYYNEPEIEALCGICTMAPVGCFAHSAEVSFLFAFHLFCPFFFCGKQALFQVHFSPQPKSRSYRSQ